MHDICKTLAEVAAAEARCDTESLWKTMTQGGSPILCWAAEDAMSRIERARFAAVGR